MKCPRCQQDYPSHAKFCLECGAPVERATQGDVPDPPYMELKHALTQALERETATGEILRVIACSPTEIGPVFAAVAASAARLCDAFDATIFQTDGDRLRVAVHNGPIDSHPVGQGPSLARGTPSGRAVLDRRTIHVANTQAEIDEYPEGSEHARRLGFRTVLAVPLVREDVAIGVITLRRTEARLFTDRQVVLLQTFANQAVIAIENVRLLTELQLKNRALTEALEQQTATSEILRVIASSPTDLQPVMDVVAENAALVCGASDVLVYRLERGELRLVASYGHVPAVQSWLLDRGHLSSRAVIDRETVHVHDITTAEADFPISAKTPPRAEPELALPRPSFARVFQSA